MRFDKTLGCPIQRLLPKMLQEIQKNSEQKPGVLFELWPQIVGEKVARFTKVIEFKEGILYVRVSSATLFSLLNTEEKPRILQLLRKRVQGLKVSNIVFRR